MSFNSLIKIILVATVVAVLMMGCNIKSTSTPGSSNPNGNNGNTGNETGIKILFIGNSLTFANDLPGLFEKLAKKAGKDVYVEERTMGGATLATHCNNSQTISMIRSRKWDYVILQSNDITAFPDMYAEEMDYVSTLQGIIESNDPSTKIIYEMIFGLKNGVTLRELNGEMVTYTYQDYIKKIHDGTLFIAGALDLIIAPVGWSWKKVVDERPDTVLFASDNAHPALRGSYLGACVFYVTIFKESVEGVDYNGGISDSEAAYFQRIATVTVMEDLKKWRIEQENQ